MTIKHLRIFINVYEEMNITKTSRLLNMTQPAVSRSIHELEDYYGVKLFERIGHRLYRTESGSDLYSRAIHIVELFDNNEKKMKSWDRKGTLRVGASVSIGSVFLPGVIKRYQSMNVDTQVSVMVSNAENIQSAILSNKLDIAVVEGNIISDYIERDFLAEDSLKVIVPPCEEFSTGRSFKLSDIVQYPLILRESGSAGRSLIDSELISHGIDVKPMWESSSTRAIINAVSEGLGISILPDRLVAEDIANKRVLTVEVQDGSFKRKNYIIWHKQKFMTKYMAEFIKICHSQERILNIDSLY